MQMTLSDKAALEELIEFINNARSSGKRVVHRPNVKLSEAEAYARDAVDYNEYDYQAEYEVKQ
jgi:hypothetical protein